MRWKVLGLIVFAILIAVFTLDNTTNVTVNFIFVTAQTNLVLVILISVLLGMMLMAILWSLRAWKLRGQVGALKKKVAQTEAELQTFRDAQAEVKEPASEGAEQTAEGADTADHEDRSYREGSTADTDYRGDKSSDSEDKSGV